MPFTLSHPAAIVPLYLLLRRYLILSALVVGSMVPDFHYYLPFHLTRSMTHNYFSIIWFSLPMGLITLLIFDWFIRYPLIEIMPSRLRTSLLVYQKAGNIFRKGIFGRVILSLLLGAFSHIFWDNLCWYHGRRLMPYDWVQIINSIFGAIILAWFCWRWYRRQYAQPNSKQPLFSQKMRIFFSLSLAILPIIFGSIIAIFQRFPNWMDFLEGAAIAGLGVWGFLLLLLGAMGYYRRREQTPETEEIVV